MAAVAGNVPISPRMARRVASTTLRTSTVVLSQDLLSRAALAGVGRASGIGVGSGAEGSPWYLRVLLRRPVPPGGDLDPEGEAGHARSAGS